MLDGDDPEGAAPPAALQLTDANDGWYPMANGLTRLATRFWGRDADLAAARAEIGKDLLAADAAAAGLVTFTPDDLDWDDEVRLTLEERASFSPDALTGMEANLRFAGPETMETKIFARLTAWQNWIFQRPNAVGPEGALRRFGTGLPPDVRPRPHLRSPPMTAVDIDATHPQQRRPGRRPPPPAGARVVAAPVHRLVARRSGRSPTRTTTSTCAPPSTSGQEGWANFDYVQHARLPLGHLPRRPRARPPHRLRRPPRRAGVAGGARRVPGRPAPPRSSCRATPSRPRSSSSGALCLTAPSLYDLRNLFQVNVEEGRHLWAMVYLLHRYFGRDGRDEADELLERHSGDADNPRILGAFNEPTPDWLSFFFFTYFTDRDGKFQLASLRESGFDPLSRTCDFMLKEEAHHMFVGADRRRPGRAAHGRAHEGARHRRRRGRTAAIDVATLQRYLNFHYSVSLDLFGAETSTNAANYFAAGLKGRFQEERRDDDHRLPRRDPRACPTWRRRGDRRRARPPRWRRSTRRCGTTTSPTARRASTGGTGRWREVGARAAPPPRRVPPGGRRVRRPPRQPRRPASLTEDEWAARVDGLAARPPPTATTSSR